MQVVAAEDRRAFVRHYLEMVAAMFVGMLVLGPLVSVAFAGAGRSDVRSRPGVAIVIMAVNMTVGMVAWMRYRGHQWGPTIEMAAAMNAPVVVVLALYLAGVISAGAGFVVEHVAMLVCMLLVMLRLSRTRDG